MSWYKQDNKHIETKHIKKKQQRPSKQYPWKMVGLPLAGAQAEWSIGPRSWQLSKFWNHCMSRNFFLCPSIIYPLVN